MLLREIKRIFHHELDTIYPQEEIDSLFYILMDHYLELERFVLALQPNAVVSKEQEQHLFEALSELRSLRPIQYILGKEDFMDLDFRVNEQVLIPRQETEELVRWIIGEYRAAKDGSIKILDIGTGSGCIAISLAKNLPGAEVHALDVSEGALAIALQNALENGVDISFVQADISTWDGPGTQFDIIVSNPPYVRESEKGTMHRNVLDHEPGLALFVPDESPLIFYEHIAHFAERNLKGQGVLYLEINQYLGKEAKVLLENHNFSEIELRKDLFGNDRMLKGKKVMAHGG